MTLSPFPFSPRHPMTVFPKGNFPTAFDTSVAFARSQLPVLARFSWGSRMGIAWACMWGLIVVGALGAGCGGVESERGLRLTWLAVGEDVCEVRTDRGPADYDVDKIPVGVVRLQVELLSANGQPVNVGGKPLKKDYLVRSDCGATATDCVTSGSTAGVGGQPLRFTGVPAPETSGSFLYQVQATAFDANNQTVWRGRNARVTVRANQPTVGVDILMKRVGASIPAYGCMNHGRAFHASVVLRDGTILISGGVNLIQNNQGDTDTMLATNTFEAFNPNTGQFTTPPYTLPEARAFHTMTLLEDGLVLIVGGASKVKRARRYNLGDAHAKGALFYPDTDPANGGSQPPNTALILNPNTGAMETLVNDDFRRMGHAIVPFPVPGGTQQFYAYLIIGGHDGEQPLDTVLWYNHQINAGPTANFTPIKTARRLVQMQAPRVGHTALLFRDSGNGANVVIMGGAGADKPFAEILPSDPTQSLPFEISGISAKLGYHAAVVVPVTNQPDQGIAIFGGANRTASGWDAPSTPGQGYVVLITTPISGTVGGQALPLEAPGQGILATGAVAESRNPIFVGGMFTDGGSFTPKVSGVLAELDVNTATPGFKAGKNTLRPRAGQSVHRMADGSILLIGGMREGTPDPANPGATPPELVLNKGIEMYMP